MKLKFFRSQDALKMQEWINHNHFDYVRIQQVTI